MYPRRLSFFSNTLSDGHAASNSKSYSEYLFGVFNWLYEHSPINFSYVTGMYHPSMQRLMGHPILGRSLEVTKDAAGLADEVAKLAKLAEKDPLGRAYLSYGPYPSMLLTRPTDIAQVLMQNGDKIDRGKLLDAFAKIFGDDNLVVIPSNKLWHDKRKQLLEWIFNAESLTGLVQPMQHIVDEFIVKINENDGHIASLEPLMVSLATEVFARTRLASEPLGEKAQRLSDGFGKALDVASEPMNTVWVRLDAILKYLGIHMSAHLNKERDELQKIIRENFLEPNQKNLAERENVLQEYFKNHPGDTQAAFKDAIGDSGILLLAGHETTSRLLEFIIILLSQHEDVLVKLRDEIAENTPENGEWSRKDLENLTYLEKIIKETLRLYPPFPVLPRMVTGSFVLADIPVCTTKEQYEEAMKTRDVTKDVVLHPGTGVNIAPWVTHRLASVYENPLEFNPDRFKTTSIDSSDNCSWIPFGAGNRNCPGRRFAMQETMLFLIQFVEKYNFKVSCKNGNPLDTLIRGTLKLRNDIQVEVTPRTSSNQPRMHQ